VLLLVDTGRVMNVTFEQMKARCLLLCRYVLIQPLLVMPVLADMTMMQWQQVRAHAVAHRAHVQTTPIKSGSCTAVQQPCITDAQLKCIPYTFVRGALAEKTNLHSRDMADSFHLCYVQVSECFVETEHASNE
jgi:hypothetical protein